MGIGNDNTGRNALPEIVKALGVTLNALYGMPGEAAPLATVDNGEDRQSGFAQHPTAGTGGSVPGF